MSSIHIVALLLLNVGLSTIVPLCHPRWVLTASCAFLSVASSSPGPEEYTVDVEISFENASSLEPIKAYLHSLSFPIQGNSTDQATNILSIEVTTGESKTHCFRMEGWAYQEKGCVHPLLLEQIVLGKQVRWPRKAWGMILWLHSLPECSPYWQILQPVSLFQMVARCLLGGLCINCHKICPKILPGPSWQTTGTHSSG